MAVNIHITIIELNALHTKRQNLFQELDAVIHLDRKSGSAGMPRPSSYAVFCLKKKNVNTRHGVLCTVWDTTADGAPPMFRGKGRQMYVIDDDADAVLADGRS